MKRKFEIVAVIALCLAFCSPVFAAKPKIISSKNLRSSEGPIVVDLGKERLVKFQLQGLDTNRIRLQVRGKELTLKSWLDQAQRKGYKIGRKQEILMTANASNFPGLSRETVNEIGRLKDFDTLTVPTTSQATVTVYVCGLIVYACAEFP